MTLQRFLLPCSCAVMLDHDMGQRLVRCEGDDPARADRRCEGGKQYVVTAERVDTVLYSAERFKGAMK